MSTLAKQPAITFPAPTGTWGRIIFPAPMPQAPRPLEDHTPDTCTCAWWYFPEQDGQGGWYVARICKTGPRVRVTAPLSGATPRLEHMARDKARRLNRIYGIPDPGDAPQEQGPGTIA